MLSRLFNLAIDFNKAGSNPCSRVRKFKLDNERYRYLLPEEEPVLMSKITGKGEHLKAMVSMGHKDLKTTMRYIRAVQLQREVRPEQVVHKLATNEIRPPALAAVNC
jgi:hypothetical protein